MSNPHTLWRLIRTEWRLKLALTALLNVIVCVPYYGLQHWQLFPERAMRPSTIDQAIAFQPSAVWLYVSLYLFMPIFPLLMTRREQLRQYAWAMIAASVVANVIFFLRPTICPRPAAVDGNVVYQMLIAIDRPFHAFPSLHAAFAVISALCGVLVLRDLRVSRRLLFVPWAWAALIAYGALATKQHVFVDIAAGTMLGLGAHALTFRSKLLVTDGITLLQQPGKETS